MFLSFFFRASFFCLYFFFLFSLCFFLFFLFSFIFLYFSFIFLSCFCFCPSFVFLVWFLPSLSFLFLFLSFFCNLYRLLVGIASRSFVDGRAQPITCANAMLPSEEEEEQNDTMDDDEPATEIDPEESEEELQLQEEPHEKAEASADPWQETLANTLPDCEAVIDVDDDGTLQHNGDGPRQEGQGEALQETQEAPRAAEAAKEEAEKAAEDNAIAARFLADLRWRRSMGPEAKRRRKEWRDHCKTLLWASAPEPQLKVVRDTIYSKWRTQIEKDSKEGLLTESSRAHIERCCHEEITNAWSTLGWVVVNEKYWGRAPQ